MSARNSTLDNRGISELIKHLEEEISLINTKESYLLGLFGVVTLILLCFIIYLICDRRSRQKQGSVPQAIVIQPNGNSSSMRTEKTGRISKSARRDKSMENEKEILPSKSMKMKVNIVNDASTSRNSSKQSASSKSTSVKTSQGTQSQSQNIINHASDEMPVNPLTAQEEKQKEVTKDSQTSQTKDSFANLSVSTPQNNTSMLNTANAGPSTATNTTSTSAASNTLAASINSSDLKAPSPGIISSMPIASISQSGLTSNNSMTFTVPEETTNTNCAALFSTSKNSSSKPITPSATTLSGTEMSKISTTGTTKSANTAIDVTFSTATTQSKVSTPVDNEEKKEEEKKEEKKDEKKEEKKEEGNKEPAADNKI